MAYDRTEIELYNVPRFRFTGGQEVNTTLAYRSFNPASTKGTVLIPTCFKGRINGTLNFTQSALKEYHVVVVAMLGNGESSSPSNDQHKFPTNYSLRYEDCVNAQYRLLIEHLGVTELEAVIGFSMGGQQAYYWTVMYPDFVKRAVAICSSAKTSGHNYAVLAGPIAALTASVDYDQGRYQEKDIVPHEGLRAFGRAWAAWIPSAEWFRQELWRVSGATSLDDYLDRAAKSYEDWDPEDLLTLAKMWQAGDLGAAAGHGDYKEALRQTSTKMLIMPGKTDQYFPPEDSESEVKLLRNATLEVIPSIWGHMAGGGATASDTNWMDKKIAAFMSEPL